MGAPVNHKRMKAKYNATPTAQEKAYHIWLMETYPCACGCGLPSSEVHHPLQRHTAQRWRRDHEFVVPMDWRCHRKVHATGSDEFADAAFAFRALGQAAGKLPFGQRV